MEWFTEGEFTPCLSWRSYSTCWALFISERVQQSHFQALSQSRISLPLVILWFCFWPYWRTCGSNLSSYDGHHCPWCRSPLIGRSDDLTLHSSHIINLNSLANGTHGTLFWKQLVYVTCLNNFPQYLNRACQKIWTFKCCLSDISFLLSFVKMLSSNLTSLVKLTKMHFSSAITMVGFILIYFMTQEKSATFLHLSSIIGLWNGSLSTPSYNSSHMVTYTTK